MSLFKTGPVELKEKDFRKYIAGIKEYKSLSSTIGEAHASGTLTAFWNKFGGMGGGKFVFEKKNESDVQKMFSQLLWHEQNCVLTAHYYIGKLANQARLGTFSRTLTGEMMAPADYGAKDRDDALERATRYLIFTSTSLKNTADKADAPVTASGIKTAIQNAALYDVRSETTLRDLHKRCVNQAALRPTRCTDKTAPYPSTGGAGFLLEATFRAARAFPQPANGSAEWFDLACFLLGAVIRSHGFTDGNGRVGRAAYAAAMVKGGLTFAPLKVTAEKILHGLDKIS